MCIWLPSEMKLANSPISGAGKMRISSREMLLDCRKGFVLNEDKMSKGRLWGLFPNLKGFPGNSTS